MRLRKFSLVISLFLFSFSILISQDLDWIGDPAEFLPPGDITIQYTDANCTSEFDMIPASGMCMWEGILDGGDMIEVWNFQVIEGMHFEGGCDVTVNYSHVPCLDAFDLPQVDSQMPPPELVASEMNSVLDTDCLLYTSPSPRDRQKSRMPSSA